MMSVAKTCSRVHKEFISLRVSFARAGVIKKSNKFTIDAFGESGASSLDGENDGVDKVIACDKTNFFPASLIVKESKSVLILLAFHSCFFLESLFINLSILFAFSAMAT